MTSISEEIVSIRKRLHNLENEKMKMDVYIEEHEEAIKELDNGMKSKVEWKHFVYIIGIYCAFMTVILGAIYFQVTNNGKLSHDNNVAISKIQGILLNAEIND